MAKFFETADDIKEVITGHFIESGLKAYGLTLKVMSTKKAKDVIKLVKANPATEFLQQSEGIILVQVFEEIFDRLDDDTRHMLIDMVFSSVSYDSEKDKIIIDSNPYNQIFRMRKKYGNVFLDKLELSYIAIQQLEEEEKQKKEEAKAAKAEAKRNG